MHSYAAKMQYTMIICMHSAVGNGTAASVGLLLVALLWTPSNLLQKETPTLSQIHGYLSALVRSWQGAAVQGEYMGQYAETEFITQ